MIAVKPCLEIFGLGALAVALLASLSSASPVAFVRTDYVTGDGPLWLVAADFDHDDNLDLAVSIFGGTTISIFLGNGSGSFQLLGDATAGTGPWGLTEGDFNEDGDLDLAATNTQNANVSILLGNGDGTFAAAPTVSAGSYPRAVGTADFNEDQNVDLAVTNLSNNTVSIHFGNGQGGFTPGPILPSGNGPGQGGKGDFNEDGDDDFAVGNQNSDDVTVWMGNGDGTFQPPDSWPVVRHAHGVVVGRVDTDSHQDLVADNNQSIPPVVSVILGVGDGSFGKTMNYASGGGGPTHVAIADFDLDGLMDLAVANRDSASISVLPGDGTGSFGAPQNFAVERVPQCLAAADYDEDGRMDLAVSGFGVNRLTVLLNRTDEPVGIAAAAAAAAPLMLEPAAPNPVRSSTRIRFRMSDGARVRLRIMDTTGRSIRMMVDGWLPAGAHVVEWDGRNVEGTGVSAGIYFFELTTASGPAAKRKLVVLP